MLVKFSTKHIFAVPFGKWKSELSITEILSQIEIMEKAEQ
jgi:hypothetical protein